jgi:hypothetical protein
VYDEIKEALRRQQIDVVGADAFGKRAEAVSKVLKSLNDTPSAMMRLGDVIIAKATLDGNARVYVETMSPQIARELEKNARLASDPQAFFAMIDREEARRLEHERVAAKLLARTLAESERLNSKDRVTLVACSRCAGVGWICGLHPLQPAGHGNCDGERLPCPSCNLGERLNHASEIGSDPPPGGP